MLETPMRLRATTRKPETAPPRRAVLMASARLFCAAEAVRPLARTAIDMPMYPDTPEASAPTMNAMPVRTPVSVDDLKEPTMTPTTTDVMMARMPIVWYWR